MRHRIDIKEEAKQILRNAHVSPILVTAVILAVKFVLDSVLNLVNTGYLFPRYMDAYRYLLSGSYTAILEPVNISAASTFFSVLVSLFTCVLSCGYYIYCMGIRQGLTMPYSSLLEGLSVAGKIIWCYVLMVIKTFLWSMLFLIPGIIAAYRYRFAYYNILTDPTLTAGDAIRLSCQQTNGIKMELFILDLSFLAWDLLSLITVGLLDLWLLPYKILSNLAYFEDAQIRLGRAPYGGATPPPSNSTPWEF